MLFTRFLEHSLQIGLLILAVLFVTWCLRYSSKFYSYILWIFVFFRLLVPFSFSTPMGILPRISLEKLPVHGVPGTELEALCLRILWGIWLSGVAVMGCYGAWGIVWLRRLLRSAVPCEKFGVKNVYQSDQIEVPIVCGIFRPSIYLPGRNMEPYQLQYIVEHEQMHIRRKDWLMKVFSYGLLCINWFNPLIWLAFIRLERSMEYSCDEAVVRRLGDGEKKAYSRTLLAVAAGRVRQGKEGVLTLGFLEKNTKRRIQNVLEYENHRKWVTAAGSIILIGCFMCFLGGGEGFQPENAWTHQKNSSIADVQKKIGEQKNTDGQKETGGTDGQQMASKTPRVQDEKDRHGLPAIVVDEDGNIIGTHGGKGLKGVVLSYTNNVENGVRSEAKRKTSYRIEDSAFSACVNMKTLIFWNNDDGDVSYVAENAFEGCPSDLVVYCKKDTYLWRRLRELHITCFPEQYDKAIMLSGRERAEEIEQRVLQSLPEEEREEMQGEFAMSYKAVRAFSREEIREYEGSPYFIMVEGGRLIDSGGSLWTEAACMGESVEYPSEARIIDGGLSPANGMAPRLVIPEGVTELGNGAFCDCEGLREIVLPESLKKIGGDCFNGCTSLINVTIKSRDVVFDEKSSETENGIFGSCGVKNIWERKDSVETNLLLLAPRGSTTQRYAEERGIRFQSID